eukprot:15479332-Alexandrium_andersonii.AAC.1
MCIRDRPACVPACVRARVRAYMCAAHGEQLWACPVLGLLASFDMAPQFVITRACQWHWWAVEHSRLRSWFKLSSCQQPAQPGLPW